MIILISIVIMIATLFVLYSYWDMKKYIEKQEGKKIDERIINTFEQKNKLFVGGIIFLCVLQIIFTLCR